MTHLSRFGVALLALVFVCLPALAATTHEVSPHHVGLVVLLGLGAGLIGTITNNYLTPGTGTTAPTQGQAAGVMVQCAQVGFGDSDTTTSITHAWSFNTSQLGHGFPFLSYWQETTGVAGTAVLTIVRNANTITVNKGTGTGSGGTWTFVLWRPPSQFVQGSGN